MRKVIILIFILTNFIYSQIGYVNIEHPVYSFLDRMQLIHIIDNYNSFELPKTRKEITDYLKIIIKKRAILSSVDSKTLDDFITEFNFDLSGSVNSYYSLFAHDTTTIFNQKEKFLYFYSDSSTFNTFINFVGSGEALYSRDKLTNENASTTLFTFGGEIRGTIQNHIGYFARATNGLHFGDKDLAAFKSNLKYNYKYSEGNHDSSQYFDETSAYLMAEYEHVKFKIGNDRINIGYGIAKTIMDNYMPPMDYLTMQFNYSVFSYTFLHGKLFGTKNVVFNPSKGWQSVIADKYFVYHRLGLNFSKHCRFGIGETIIYANRNIDFSYLNPFLFYKSAEHANQDRDNSMLFFDFQNNSVKGLSFYAMLLIDDVDFSKLGTNWYGNKFLFDAGASYELFPSSIPLTVAFQYLRINPYVYSHRINNNNYTSLNIGLGSNIEPNSESFLFNIKYKPHYRVRLGITYRYTKHGANKTDANGNVLVNYGGDILVGHREIDSDEVIFLNGIEETINHFTVTAEYEPIKNYLLILQTDILKTNKENLTILNKSIINLIFSIRI
jgi:hypothetical protein